MLGGAELPKIPLSSCTERYWPLCTDRLVNKSEDQIRKWKNPRIAVMNSFINVIGDKSLNKVIRADILQYRQWWMKRIENGEAVASTVNKNMMYLGEILHIVAIFNEIETDFDLLFSKIRLKELEQSRPPFEVSFVQNTLLTPDSMKMLHAEAKLLIFAMADTGARESELIGLRKEDIFLNEPIPYIWIRALKNRALKTITSER